jgi:hypothetical protein
MTFALALMDLLGTGTAAQSCSDAINMTALGLPPLVILKLLLRKELLILPLLASVAQVSAVH